MTVLVDSKEIEEIVGAKRHPSLHLARGVGGDVFILHSAECVKEHADLRDCAYSKALDRGITGSLASMWLRRWGRTCVVELVGGRLIPRLAVTFAAAPRVELLGQAGDAK